MSRSRELLETTDLPVEHIAQVTGFGSAASLRAHFRERLGSSPSAYRRAFRTGLARRQWRGRPSGPEVGWTARMRTSSLSPSARARQRWGVPPR
jgi:hypothetical protein